MRPFSAALLLEPLRRGAALQAMPRPRRYRLRRGHSDALLEPFGESFELPQVNPSRFRQAQATVTWGTGLGAGQSSIFFDRTVRLDLASGEQRVWQRPDAMQLEPLFVARPGASAED